MSPLQSPRRSVLILALSILGAASQSQDAAAQVVILPDPYVFSGVGVRGDLSSFICGTFVPNNFGLFCNAGNVNGETFNGGNDTETPGFTVHVSGHAADVNADFGVPFVVTGRGTASATASTSPWVHRARASASGASPGNQGPESNVNPDFTPSVRYNEYNASGSATSEWINHLRITGPQAGTAILNFLVEGTMDESIIGSSNQFPGSVVFEFFLFDPNIGYSEAEPELAVAYANATYGGSVDIDELIPVRFNFVPNKTYIALSRLTVLALSGGTNGTACDGNGFNCFVGPGNYADADYDFFNTVTVSSIDVPAGNGAVGFEGSPLPFPVPEPASAGGVGLLWLALLGRYAREAGRHSA